MTKMGANLSQRPGAAMLAALGAVSAGASPLPRREPALVMTCHPLLNGEPMNEVTSYSLVGPDLFTQAAGRTLRISNAGKPLFLSRDLDRGLPVFSWADHLRAGQIVVRRVYWKTGDGPRRLRSTERYDFQRQTLTRSGIRGDTCHHAE